MRVYHNFFAFPSFLYYNGLKGGYSMGTTIDIIIVLILLMGAVVGFKRGVIKSAVTPIFDTFRKKEFYKRR